MGAGAEGDMARLTAGVKRRRQPSIGKVVALVLLLHAVRCCSRFLPCQPLLLVGRWLSGGATGQR